jgi:ABC-type multidrug transport system fused ATPase/permease subunit
MTTLPKSLYAFLFKYGVRPFAWSGGIWIFCAAIATALWGLLTPLTQKWFVSIFEMTVPAGETLLSVAMPTMIMILSVYVGGSVISLVRNIAFYRFIPFTKNHMSQVLNDYLNAQSMGFFTSRMPGKINSQINYIANGIRILEDYAKMMITGVIILLNLGLILQINGWVALILGFSFFTRIGWSLWRARPMSKASKQASESASSLSGKVVDSISNFPIVKLFAGMLRERKYIGAARKTSIDDNIQSGYMQRWFWSPMSFLWDILFALTLVVCVRLYMNGGMLISDAVFTITVFKAVMDLIDDIIYRIPDIIEVSASAQQSYKELVKPIEVLDAENAPDLRVKNAAIDIRGVSFKYGKKKVLDNFSLNIKPGEKVGLVGASGAGKTTLVNLLMRFYDPGKGAILIDGQNIRDVAQDSLRQNITFIPQEPALFNRTLLENISYGKPGATLKQVRAAAKNAALDDFIMDAEKKYDSMVGDRGIKLSGGQKQRVAIARAFLKDAPILILDEATSALDSETEAVIQESFNKLSRGRTTIAIAHRLSTLRNMDRIVVMDNGRIMESGTHATLIKKKGGIYAKLWKMQSGGFLQE